MLDFSKACLVVVLLSALPGCITSNVSQTEDPAPRDTFNAVRNADLSPRFPTTEGRSEVSGESAKPILFPGADVDPEPRRNQDQTIHPTPAELAYQALFDRRITHALGQPRTVSGLSFISSPSVAPRNSSDLPSPP